MITPKRHVVHPEHPREEDTFSLSEVFHEATKMRRRINKTYSSRIATVLNHPARYEFMTRAYRTYPNCPTRPLPKPAIRFNRPFHEVVLSRRSARSFQKDAPLSLDALSTVLYYSYAVSGEQPFDGNGRTQPLRPVPSGGALYPLEIYPLVVSSAEASLGVYHYDVVNHSIELLTEKNDSNAFRDEIAAADNLDGFSILLVITAVFERTLFKYWDRGYRFVLLDAGHVAQNVCLTASALRLGSVCLGGFYDDEINSLVGANGVDESAVYLVALGNVTATGEGTPS